MNLNRRRLLACTIGTGATSLGGCLGFGDTDRDLPAAPSGTWSQSGHDAANTGGSAVDVPPRGTVAWSSGSAQTIPPLVDGDTVFSIDTELIALDGQSGEQRWETDLDVDSPDGIVTPPAVTDEQILLGTKGKVRSFDRESGDTRWESQKEGVPIGSVTVAPDHDIGILAFERGRSDEPLLELEAVGLEGGDTKWTAPLRVSDRTMPPAVFDGTVYATGYDDSDAPVLRGFDIRDGTLSWEQSLESPDTPPTGTDTGILVGDGGTLSIYDPADGRRQDAVQITSGDIAAIAVADERIFVLSDDGLTALSTADRTEQWAVQGHPQANGLAVGRETVVAPIASDVFDLETSWPTIGAFDRADGSVSWQYAVDDAFDPAVSAPPVIADSAVFVLTNTTSGVTALGDLPPSEE